MRRSAVLLACLEACGSAGRETREAEPGTSWQGVYTQLSAAGDFALGKPIPLKLELVNSGGLTIVFDSQQAGVNHSLSVWGPDGRLAPYIHGSVQTGGSPQVLRPGERALLFEGLDLASQYLIAAPGPYTIQFKGDGLWVIDGVGMPYLLARRPEPDDAGPGEIMKLWTSRVRLPSDKIHIRVAEGKPSKVTVLAQRLRAILPVDWEVGLGVHEGVICVSLIRPARLKADCANVFVWIAPSPPAEVRGEQLGSSRWGRVYLESGARSREEWPDLRDQLIIALEIAP